MLILLAFISASAGRALDQEVPFHFQAWQRAAFLPLTTPFVSVALAHVLDLEGPASSFLGA